MRRPIACCPVPFAPRGICKPCMKSEIRVPNSEGNPKSEPEIRAVIPGPIPLPPFPCHRRQWLIARAATSSSAGLKAYRAGHLSAWQRNGGSGMELSPCGNSSQAGCSRPLPPATPMGMVNGLFRLSVRRSVRRSLRNQECWDKLGVTLQRAEGEPCGALEVSAFGDANCEASQPPPNVLINWTLAVICSMRRLRAVR
jgi:hypothetical protein